MHSQPDLGITDPYELNKKQFDATVNLLKQQRKLVKLYWNYDTDGRAAFANGDVSLGAIWPVRHARAPGEERAGQGGHPLRRRDRLGRHVDAAPRRRRTRTAPTCG